MDALPDLAATKDKQTTGVSCPDCPGVLEVHSEGHHLRFRCRIGHTYSLQDLLQSKEIHLESALWAPVTALEEMAALLLETIAQGRAIGGPEEYEKRAARALNHAKVIRQVIEDNQPMLIVGSSNDVTE